MLAALLLLAVSEKPIDATTLVGKVMCGYQGWFRTPGDPDGRGWAHWSRDRRSLNQENATFEMWPDTREYPAKTLAPALGGKLFSSAYPEVTDLHFKWMRQYGIDGVFVQRFVSEVDDFAKVLSNVRRSAEKEGRTFAVEYDMSGSLFPESLNKMKRDWAFLRDTLKITKSPRYLHHRGKPVLAIFGFFADRITGTDANSIIDAFSGEVSLVGAGQWWWRRETQPEWSRAFRRFTAYSPWDVGNARNVAGVLTAATDRWADDLVEAQRSGMLLLPVIYPGFSWDRLKRLAPGTSLIPRRRGAFFREQFAAAASLKIGQSFVAMFDEVDEGTAVFKVAEAPGFLGLEGLESDAYLRMTGEGAKLIQGK
jgi:hypothetical protein